MFTQSWFEKKELCDLPSKIWIILIKNYTNQVSNHYTKKFQLLYTLVGHKSKRIYKICQDNTGHSTVCYDTYQKPCKIQGPAHISCYSHFWCDNNLFMWYNKGIFILNMWNYIHFFLNI
jgi:hypothetical protein